MADWSDEELRSTVRAYLAMLAAQEQGVPYSKAETRRSLRKGALKARSDASIEYRMRNISEVLTQHGRSILQGYLPAQNVGPAASGKIWSMLQEFDAVPAVAQKRTAIGKSRTSPTPSKRPPIIYFNVGWMKRYAGPAADDPTIGAHGYLGSHVHGAESFNFLRTPDGVVRGYRPPGARERVNLNNLGVPTKQAELEGALVIWMAREPGTRRTLIVGWYRNATVYRVAKDGGIDLNGERIHYSVEASADDATLLAPVARTFAIRSSRVSPGAGFGQKPTWYGADEVDELVWSYVRNYGRRRSTRQAKVGKKPPKNYDPELRRKVERAAVEHATAHYKEVFGADCPVISVETEAKGWDLEVHCGPQPLLVEVKGLLNSTLVCELTPNEYHKMKMSAHRSRYVVYVVNSALAQEPAAPIASVFEHKGKMIWRTQDGRELKIEEKTGAVLTSS